MIIIIMIIIIIILIHLLLVKAILGFSKNEAAFDDAGMVVTFIMRISNLSTMTTMMIMRISIIVISNYDEM